MTANRALGAFLGLAAGDALGATLEFLSPRDVRWVYPNGLREIVGGGAFNWAPGETTDDTAMALCVARGILAAGKNAPVGDIVNAVGEEFVRWADSRPKDMGNTVRLAIAAYRRHGDWARAAVDVRSALGKMAAGNGALMRTLPVALPWLDEPARTVSVARALARMTHPAPEAEWTSAAYTLYVRALIGGADKEEAWKTAVVTLGLLAMDLWQDGGREGVGAQLASRLDPGMIRSMPEDRIRPTGYTVDTLEAAMWAFLTTDGAEECIVRAANLGGDADTVAAVAGGLAGARYGVDALPRRWLDRLDRRVREEIHGLVDRILASG